MILSAAFVVLAAAAPVAVLPASTPVHAAPAPAALTATPTDRRVEEDDNVRIEETRSRGESLRIVVKPKAAGIREYEIVPASGAVDPSQRQQRRGNGERVWRVLNF